MESKEIAEVFIDRDEEKKVQFYVTGLEEIKSIYELDEKVKSIPVGKYDGDLFQTIQIKANHVGPNGEIQTISNGNLPKTLTQKGRSFFNL